MNDMIVALLSRPSHARVHPTDPILGWCAECLAESAATAFVPCGHIVHCWSCANAVFDRTWGTRRCPECAAEVSQVLAISLASVWSTRRTPPPTPPRARRRGDEDPAEAELEPPPWDPLPSAEEMDPIEEEALWAPGDLSRVREWLIDVGAERAEPRFYAVWHVPGRPELRGVHCADGYQAYTTIVGSGSFGQIRWRACDTAIEAAVVYRHEADVHGAPLPPVLHCWSRTPQA